MEAYEETRSRELETKNIALKWLVADAVLDKAH